MAGHKRSLCDRARPAGGCRHMFGKGRLPPPISTTGPNLLENVTEA